MAHPGLRVKYERQRPNPCGESPNGNVENGVELPAASGGPGAIHPQCLDCVSGGWAEWLLSKALPDQAAVCVALLCGRARWCVVGQSLQRGVDG